MIPDKKSNYASLSSKNFLFRGNDDVLPLYSAGMGGYGSRGNLNITTYLGPLDVDRIDLLAENKSVSSIMNFGWSIIQPFSRAVLWTVKIIHNYPWDKLWVCINSYRANYACCYGATY